MSDSYFKRGKLVRSQTCRVLFKLREYFNRKKHGNEAESVNERIVEATGVWKRPIQRVLADEKGVFRSATRERLH